MTIKQKTLATPVTISGKGLHTGVEVNLKINPAPENYGISFKRIDVEGQPIIKANCDMVVDTSRGTTIGKDGTVINTIEHVMAALTGMGIDNALVEIDNEETPIMDGSAHYFTEALKNAGIIEQDAEKKFFVIDKVLTYKDEKNKVELMIIPDDKFRLSVMIDFETEVLSSQHATLENITDFNSEISNCRTFVFLHELEFLLANNLIKGGDLSNAIIFVDREMSQEELDRLAKLFNKPTVKVLKKGILNNVELNFENEPARHKLLDLIGDLALSGIPLKGHVIARRPGHKANVEFAKIIKKHMTEKEKNRFLPPFDLYAEPIFDINQIKKLLPHRPPFLLVDKIIDIDDTYVAGLKNVTMNEDFFVGHFPDEPVMPGVLQVEAMAQTGGIFILSQMEDPENYITYFLKIDKVKFRSKVVPGDTVVFVCKLISPIRRGLVHMLGKGYVGNKQVIEAEMLAQIAKKDSK
ncbi:MAG: UDP-3-O-[3-hydroxymyristoyl] N-acetylglucosamine deacetylase [Bacteroidetes bacterium]|nr:MAG: UDP-3-O-[3-hydroxymyristoyl] N-acetylglucosamine deacetylase [Bacteroidota bacterium]